MNPLLPLLRRATTHRRIPAAAAAVSAVRHFSPHPARAGLKITNPRADPATGAPMDILLTPRAITRLTQIREKDNDPSVALRLTVESGGCHGFQYTIGLSSEVDAEEDTLFTDEDTGVKVVMDEPSLELLKGSTVDYTQELIGSQFTVTNPAASSSCGCGTSFDIKF